MKKLSKPPTPDEHLEMHPLLEFSYVQNKKVVKDLRPDAELQGE